MKKILFTMCFLAAASAFAIFIPLQKDGSVRWTTNAEGYVSVDKAVPATEVTGDRKPAGNYVPGPDAYVEDPVVEEPYTPPRVTTPPPVYQEPEAPTYSGDYSCLKEGYRRAGYSKVSTGFINSVAVRSRMHYSGAKSGGFLGFIGGKVDEEKNFKRSIKNAIFNLSALGVCNSSSYPNGVGAELLGRTATEAEYQRAFKLSPKAVIKNFSTPWNPAGIDQINTVFGSNARKTNGQLYNCTKQRESASVSRDLCRSLIRTCSEMICGKGKSCGIASQSDCNYEEPRESGNGNGNGNNGGNDGGNNHNGGNHNGNGNGNNGNSNGNNNGSHETPGGNNAESGYGTDGNNNGGAMGDGPK